MPKTNAQYQQTFRQREKQRAADRQQLLRALFEGAPANFGKRMRFSMDPEGGTATVTIPDQECADHVNRFAAKIGVDPDAVLREIALYAAGKLGKGAS